VVTTEKLAFQQSVIPSRLTFVFIPFLIEPKDLLNLAKYTVERPVALIRCRQKTHQPF
jgi:hypothetical protein